MLPIINAVAETHLLGSLHKGKTIAGCPAEIGMHIKRQYAPNCIENDYLFSLSPYNFHR